MPNGSGHLEAWPQAAVTIRFNGGGERGRHELYAREVIGLVRSTVATGPERANPQFVAIPYYDDQDGLVIGQTSNDPRHQLIVIPEESDRPFFLFSRSYDAIRVLSYRWEGSRSMVRTTEEEIIEGTKEFAERLRSAYQYAAALDEFPSYED